MIAIVDYGMGNLRSVQNALSHLEYESVITSNPKQILKAHKIILPGVGAFGEAMKNIRKRQLIEPLNHAVLIEKKPILGICLGMQLLLEKSYEHGEHKGLGWIPGTVERFKTELQIPHIGFNNTQPVDMTLFNGLPSDIDFYFVHSFHAKCRDIDVASWTEYGYKFASSVRKDNIYGTQFHPEKSQTNGLRVLRNFLENA